ncbi:caspase domain-containing protein [Chloroflexota bacterium]
MLTRAFKWTAGAWVFLLFTLFLSAYTSTNAYAVDAPQYWAVVVGISEYADSNLDVDCTARSATEIYDQMASIWGYDHTKLIVDSEATKSNIQSGIVNWLGSRAGENDTVLFFFTGHGDDSESQQDYLCAHDDDISDIELNDWMCSIQSKAQIVILDSCHSGGFIEELSHNNRIVMTACDADQHACTLFSLGHSIFSFCVLQAFNNLADVNHENDGLISAEEIYQYANSQVPKYIGSEQNPRFYDGYTGELELLTVPITNTEITTESPPATGYFASNIWFATITGVAGIAGVVLLVFVLRTKLLKRKRSLL